MGSVGFQLLRNGDFVVMIVSLPILSAKSSLKLEDAVPDTTGLEPAEEKTLQGWYEFFEKVSNVLEMEGAGVDTYRCRIVY